MKCVHQAFFPAKGKMQEFTGYEMGHFTEKMVLIDCVMHKHLKYNFTINWCTIYNELKTGT